MGTAEALKSQLKDMGDRREALESEVALRAARLEASGGVGMTGALVDAEGFPRADVDVAAIRADRHAIITLTNDHKALSRQMEVMLHQLHALATLPGASSGGGGMEAVQPQRTTAAQQRRQNLANRISNGHPAPVTASVLPFQQPFAVIDEVSDGSPAAAAGLQLGDRMCSFGGVTAVTAGTLQAVAAALQANEGQAVEAVVLRQGAATHIQLTPQRWGGRGLLGCHLRPL